MGNKLFGVDISGIINKSIGPGVNACTLIKVSAGTRTTGSLTAGTNPTTTSHSARGFIDVLSRDRIDGTLVQDGDQMINLVGDSIADSKTPVPGDRITIRGATYNIIKVEVDPADALYMCTCRSE